MYKLKDLLAKAENCGISEEIKVIFPFNLPIDMSNSKGLGIVVCTEARLYIIWNDKIIKSVPSDTISDFKFYNGVGCISIEAKSADGTFIVSRSNAKHTKMYIDALSDLMSLIKGDEVHPVEYFTGRGCPKCGKPLSSGSRVCNSCKGKGSELLRLAKIASPWKLSIIISLVLYFVTAGLNLLPPLINSYIVDNYIHADDGAEMAMVFFVVLLFSLAFTKAVIYIVAAIRAWILQTAGMGVHIKLRQMLFDKIQAMSISKISTRTAGELLNRISNDTDTIKWFFCADFGEMIREVIILFAVGIILFIYDWRIALIILLPMPLVLFFNHFVRKKTAKFFRMDWKATNRASTILQDTFTGIRVVKTYGMESREIERHREATDQQRKISIKSQSYTARTSPVMTFLIGIGEFFILYYAGNHFLNGTMTLGEITMFSTYVATIYEPLRWVSTFPRAIANAMTAVSKVFEIMDDETDVPDSDHPVEFGITGKVELEDLCFSYDGADRVLRGVNATINPGEMIGIVGRSGVGKSTLINMLMRMYDPSDGSIFIDGNEIRDIDQVCLRSQMGVVLQETYLFSGSIYDNIAYARPDATTEEILAVSKLSGAHKFIVKLPDGYNTKVGEHGHSLSGGERQRVSIARALLRDPKILILDEATSALDTETEKEVQDALQKLTQGRTTFAIAHRLSTLRNADKIMVIDKGVVAEFGSHEELMRQEGIYYGLVMAQRQMSKIIK